MYWKNDTSLKRSIYKTTKNRKLSIRRYDDGINSIVEAATVRAKERKLRFVLHMRRRQ